MHFLIGVLRSTLHAVLPGLLAACLSIPDAAAKSEAEVAFARAVLKKLQKPSFEKNREYCGFIGYLPGGKLHATTAVAGDTASCAVDYPANLRVVASYHTHGAYSARYRNEVPSDKDVLSDAEGGIDGYVSTPGGRFWFVDGQNLTVTLICGPGCLPSDPNFVDRGRDLIATHYSFEALTALFGK